MNKKNKYLKPAIIFLLVFFIVVSQGQSIAHALKLNIDYPAVRVPGGIFDINTAYELGKVGIKEYIIFIYASLLWISGIIAFIMLVRTGVVYIISGNKAEAKKRFTAVLLGLFIMLLSFIFLNIISEDITDVDKSFALQVISKDDAYIFRNSNLEGGEVPGTFDCTWDSQNAKCGINYSRLKCAPRFKPDSIKCNTLGLSITDCALITGNDCIGEYGNFSCQWESGVCSVSEENCQTGSFNECYLADNTAAELCNSMQNSPCAITGSGGGSGGNPPPTPPPGGLLTPPNLNLTPLVDGYFRMPPSIDGSYNVTSPTQEQCGQVPLIRVIYTVAQNWQKNHPSLPITVRDLNGLGHKTHDYGVDVDIVVGGGVTSIKSRAQDDLTTELAKLFIDTGVVTGIAHDNTRIQASVNNYFRTTQPGLTPWKNRDKFMRDITGHGSHFHVRIGDGDGAAGTGISWGPCNTLCTTDTGCNF